MPLDNLDPTDLFTAVETKLDAAIDKVNEIDLNITGGTTDQVLKKVDGTDYNYDWGNSVLPSSGTANLKVKILEIGDWNMDSTATVSVAHGLTLANIRSITTMIRNDSNTVYSLLERTDVGGSPAGSVGNIATNIDLSRVTAGTYDSTSYDSTGFNRGYITIIYEG